MNANMQINNEEKDVVFSHVSWSSVLAGSLISISIFFMLILFSSALGMTIMDFEGGISLTATTWLNGIWMIFSSLISIACGSYIAGRLSENITSFGGMISGILVWTLLSILTLTMVSKGISYTLVASNNTLESIIPKQYPQFISLPEALNIDNISMSNIQKQIDDFDAPEIKGVLKEEYSALKTTAKNVGENFLFRPASLERGLNTIEDQVKISSQRLDRVLTKEKLKEVIGKNNSALSIKEVDRIATNWRAEIQQYSQNIQQELLALKADLKEIKTELVKQADETKNGVAITLAILFLMMVFGAIVSLLAGKKGVKASKVVIV